MNYSLDKDSGKGNATVKISATPNTDKDSRTGKLLIKVNGILRKSIAITQKGSGVIIPPEPEPTHTLYVQTDVQVVEATGGTIKVTYWAEKDGILIGDEPTLTGGINLETSSHKTSEGKYQKSDSIPEYIGFEDRDITYKVSGLSASEVSTKVTQNSYGSLEAGDNTILDFQYTNQGGYNFSFVACIENTSHKIIDRVYLNGAVRPLDYYLVGYRGLGNKVTEVTDMIRWAQVPYNNLDDDNVYMKMNIYWSKLREVLSTSDLEALTINVYGNFGGSYEPLRKGTGDISIVGKSYQGNVNYGQTSQDYYDFTPVNNTPLATKAWSSNCHAYSYINVIAPTGNLPEKNKSDVLEDFSHIATIKYSPSLNKFMILPVSPEITGRSIETMVSGMAILQTYEIGFLPHLYFGGFGHGVWKPNLNAQSGHLGLAIEGNLAVENIIQGKSSNYPNGYEGMKVMKINQVGYDKTANWYTVENPDSNHLNIIITANNTSALRYDTIVVSFSNVNSGDALLREERLTIILEQPKS